MKTLILTLVLFTSLSLNAHKGHNHDAPTTLRAPKGGQLKALDESRVEVLAKGENLKIYFYDLNMKELAPTDFDIKAKVTLPKSKKSEDLQFKGEENFLEAFYDGKGTHRYTLKIDVTHFKTKMTDTLTFQIEPKK